MAFPRTYDWKLLSRSQYVGEPTVGKEVSARFDNERRFRCYQNILSSKESSIFVQFTGDGGLCWIDNEDNLCLIPFCKNNTCGKLVFRCKEQLVETSGDERRSNPLQAPFSCLFSHSFLHFALSHFQTSRPANEYFKQLLVSLSLWATTMSGTKKWMSEQSAALLENIRNGSIPKDPKGPIDCLPYLTGVFSDVSNRTFYNKYKPAGKSWAWLLTSF